MRQQPPAIRLGLLRAYGATVVKRTLRTFKCNPTGVTAGIVTTRCGREIPKPKSGMPEDVASFGWDCPACKEETERILAPVAHLR